MGNDYFSFNADLQDGALSAAFMRSGRAIAVATANVGARQEIGRFETELPPETLAGLQKLKRSIDFGALPPTGPGQPGMASVTIRETRGDVDEEPRAWWLFEIPPVVQPLIDQARRLSEEVMKHPVRALRGRGAARGPSFPAGAPASFEVTLEALGTQPLRATNPLSTKDPKYTGLRLVVTRDVPPAHPDYRELWLDLTPQHVLPPPGVKAERGPVIDLKPGERAAFVVSHALLAAPGRYRGLLVYDSVPAGDDQEFVAGTLRVDLGAFDVTPAKP
jgi:hypothetical protein